MTTLYVTDLDGTLMRTDKTLSRYTLETVNRLIDEGMLITYATARLFQSAYEITKDIHFNLPVITRNGTVFADPIKQNEIEILQFSEQDMNNLKILLGDKIRKFGFVTSYIDGKIVKNFGNREISNGYENDKMIQGFIGLSGEYIEGIFVSVEMQSHGIGRLLLDYIKNRKTKLSLNVYQQNTRAISFYKREGFEIKSYSLDKATGEKDYFMTWQQK